MKTPIQRRINQLKQWSIIGYYSCNACGFQGTTKRKHLGCKVGAVFIKPTKPKG